MAYEILNDLVHAYPWVALAAAGYSFLLYAATAIWRL